MNTAKYFILILAGLMAFIAMGSVSAADGDKYVSSTGLDTNNGDSFDTAYLTIQKGLDNVANTRTVYIAPGTYSGQGKTNLDVKTAEVTISGAGQEQTIIDGQNTNQILIINPGEKVTIKNLTIQKGAVNGDGGGIYNTGILTLNDCRVQDNTASDTTTGGSAEARGGGIYNEGTLTINNSNILNNNNTPPYPKLELQMPMVEEYTTRWYINCQ
ncbi:MAG: hypothetical protein HVN35_10215 [Methanobacteriaceae archaeon]|nr:hypothetical protein [Methanobacteriaceae archaeon]